MKPIAAPVSLAFLVSCGATAALSQSSACTTDWMTKPDDQFAMDCADMAFGKDLKARETLAWMIFARVNRLIDDPDGNGMSGTGQAPLWMSWATDPDTFPKKAADGSLTTLATFDFALNPRNVMKPSEEKGDLVDNTISTEDPDGANEEVNRNPIAYEYLTGQGLVTRAGVADFFDSNDMVMMPVGSIELKASWLQVTEGSPAPDGALTFEFDSGEYWWRGLHLMVKMRQLTNPYDIYYSEDPSWFWSTFEFNKNPGVGHVRSTFSTQRAPLSGGAIEEILTEAGSAGFGFEAYAPNGTQIRFTVDGEGTVPVILGHSDMEDFAGLPNTAQPQYWTSFQASCHACHATAAYRPGTAPDPSEKHGCAKPGEAAFFPFSVPTGALHPGYNKADSCETTEYLGQGFLPLDFMWPIAFQTK